MFNGETDGDNPAAQQDIIEIVKNLYRETGDIYLVADVLGHSDVNTTKKHYAALEDERRRSARNKVQLREKE